jgi:hypothetical protein
MQKNSLPITILFILTTVLLGAAPSRLLACNSMATINIQFKYATSDVSEGAGTFSTPILVTTSDGCPTNHSATVQFATEDITTDGGDHAILLWNGSGSQGLSITIPPGTNSNSEFNTLTSIHGFHVGIYDDAIAESSEEFRAYIVFAQNCTTNGNASHWITILDNDTPAPTPTPTPNPPQRSQIWHYSFAGDLHETPYVGDFNGDMKTDIVTFTHDEPGLVGQAFVALSTGSSFGSSALWSSWFAVGADEKVLIGDFNGDGMDDAATWLAASSRQVYVATSTGSSFSGGSEWSGGIGVGANDVVVAGDVNGDGRADLIDFVRDTDGRVLVALSTGASFAAPVEWTRGFAISTYERPRVADVNGDHIADIITFATDSPAAFGDVYVALSSGTGFGAPTKWHDWFAINPQEEVRFGDLNHDGVQDFLTFLSPQYGDAYTSLSNGSGMGASVRWYENIRVLWTDQVSVGDVNSDGKADVIVFAQSEGRVYVSPAP